MIYQRGFLARPLDAALSAASRVAVLRVLAGAGEVGRAGRVVARQAGINHQSAALALYALRELGVAASFRDGRRTVWRLDRRRWLVREVLLPMMEREAAHAEGVSAAIKAALRGRCKAALIVGDAAVGRQAPGKPLQLVVVEGASRRALSDALRELKSELDAEWALALDARIASPNEATRIAAMEDAWRLLPDEGPGFVSARR